MSETGSAAGPTWVPVDSTASSSVDPVVTEVIRHGVNSAANQMKQTLIRTAFSPIIYEVLDFATVLFDRSVQLLAQSESQPIFVGPLNFAVSAAVEAVGGEEALDEGDILLFNDPYAIGSHTQDVTVIMPVFHDDVGLIGYSAIKAHWIDIAGKEPYTTDSVDVFQEGTIYPGVKIYRGGDLSVELYRTILANSRLPKNIEGDLNAQIAGVRVGGKALRRLVDRWGIEVFVAATERLFDHGEDTVRAYIRDIPDGRYEGYGEFDNDGIGSEPLPFEVALEVEGASIRLDFANSPEANEGPLNTPRPATIAASRVAVTMLAGGGEAPNEGHFRPIEVITRPGSMFDARPPAPCFLYAWVVSQVVEVIYSALSEAIPERVPACSGGDACAFAWWGVRRDGRAWADHALSPIGQGAHSKGDGGNALPHIVATGTRFASCEVWEAKNPFLLETFELATDSCGAGRYRGGLGVNMDFRFLEETWLTSTLERTQNSPWGLNEGREARPNSATVVQPDGQSVQVAKATRVRIEPGGRLKLRSGGGGGYGDPSLRDAEAVRADVAGGYLSEEYADRFFVNWRL